MASVYLIGGLGNQLFQICNVIAYALRYDKKFDIDHEIFKMGPPRPTYWSSIFKYIEKYTIQEKPQNIATYKEPHYHYKEVPNIQQPIKFFGYYQSYKYFEDKFDDIKDILRYTDFKTEMKREHPMDLSNSISIHFRLGDYKYIQQCHPVMDIKYYIAALKNIIKHTQKNNWNILYFCEKEDNDYISISIKVLHKTFPDCTFTKVDDDLVDWKQMILMSCCEHNIIANSSFSWWGAYFNENPEKIVCYPCVWFGPNMPNHDTKDQSPPSWNKISW